MPSLPSPHFFFSCTSSFLSLLSSLILLDPTASPIFPILCHNTSFFNTIFPSLLYPLSSLSSRPLLCLSPPMPPPLLPNPPCFALHFSTLPSSPRSSPTLYPAQTNRTWPCPSQLFLRCAESSHLPFLFHCTIFFIPVVVASTSVVVVVVSIKSVDTLFIKDPGRNYFSGTVKTLICKHSRWVSGDGTELHLNRIWRLVYLGGQEIKQKQGGCICSKAGR